MTEPLSRIPLSPEDEHTVSSMARWMRFMAVVGICGSLFMLLVVVLGAGIYSSMQGMAKSSTDPEFAKIQSFIAAHGWVPYWLGLVFVLAAAVSLWQNMILYHAGDDFQLVATTDAADLEYVARGLDRLRSFFKIQVLTVVIAIGVSLITGLVALGTFTSK